MARILVAGNINFETTVRVDGFPLEYETVRYPNFGVSNGVSGVGYNLSKALATLGDDVTHVALTGRDLTAKVIRTAMADAGIGDRYVLGQVEQAPLSVIMYDETGKRAIFVDVKDLMEQRYPEDLFLQAAADCEALLFTQVGYCPPLLTSARATGKLLASDLQLIHDIAEPYKLPYLQNVDVLFMSHEQIPEPAESWVEHLLERYGNLRVVVVSLGAEGSLLATREGLRSRTPAVVTRPIVNTSGAGDALFASFMHYYIGGTDPATALRKATIFASWKIGAAVSSAGQLDSAGVEALYRQKCGGDNG